MRATDVEGNLPLEVAARFNNDYMCKKLLEHIEQSPSNDNESFRLQGKEQRIQLVKQVI